MADPLQTLVTQYPQEARSYTPTWREYLASALMGDRASQPKRDFVSGLMGSTGLGSTGIGLADVTPLGALMGMQESYRAGDPQGMALAVAPFGVGIRGATKGIRAYHSSPHDFDRFDMSKIGTGQGAQSFGHGIYAAENPAVSGFGGQYWHEFSNKFLKDNPEGRALDYLKHYGLDRKKAAGAIDEELAWHEYNAKNSLNPQASEKNSKLFSDLQQARDLLESNKPIGPRTYEVNINAKPEQFLDWDKPLYQQDVARAVREAVPADLRHVFDKNVASGITGANAYLNYLPSQSFPIKPSGSSQFVGSGAKTYDEALAMVGGDHSRVRQVYNPSKEGASQALREAGIPGIKYLDQGSRGAAAAVGKPDAIAIAKYQKEWDALVTDRRKAAGDMGRGDTSAVDKQMDAIHKRMMDETIARDPNAGRTYNYVVNNADIIDIVKKYGILGALMAGGGAAGSDQAQAAP